MKNNNVQLVGDIENYKLPKSLEPATRREGETFDDVFYRLWSMEKVEPEPKKLRWFERMIKWIKSWFARRRIPRGDYCISQAGVKCPYLKYQSCGTIYKLGYCKYLKMADAELCDYIKICGVNVYAPGDNY